jgi:hypothetical protein
MTHGLATHHQIAHVRRQIRGHMLAPESLGAALTPDKSGHNAGTSNGTVVVPLHTGRPRRDGATRIAALVPLDCDNRASLAKPLAALGWDRTTRLVAEIYGHRAVVRAGEPTETQPWLVAIRVSGARLSLPPTLTGALAVGGGDQVLAVALPATGELQLFAAADALQELTGDLPRDPANADSAAASTATQPAPRTRVRPAFGHGM